MLNQYARRTRGRDTDWFLRNLSEVTFESGTMKGRNLRISLKNKSWTINVYITECNTKDKQKDQIKLPQFIYIKWSGG